MNVHWTDTALAHLTAIYDFISRDSPRYAQRTVDRLTHRTQQLALFPESGRSVPEVNLPQIREVIEGPYRIIYHLLPNQIDIVAVLHGAQQTPWSPSPEEQ